MKKFACLAVIVLSLSALGAAFITQFEGIVSGALTSLKFESVPPQAGIVGAPPKFKVTKATIDYLQKLEKDHKVIEVQGDGSIQIK